MYQLCRKSLASPRLHELSPRCPKVPHYEPVRHPTRPGLSLAGVRLKGTPLTAGASRVASDLPVQTCRRHYPGGTTVRVGRSLKNRDGGLPRVSAGSAPTLNISRPARRSLRVMACLLAGPPRGPFHRRLRRFRYLHDRSDCYRLEPQLPGGSCTH
jgi:hypothetical protein